VFQSFHVPSLGDPVHTSKKDGHSEIRVGWFLHAEGDRSLLLLAEADKKSIEVKVDDTAVYLIWMQDDQETTGAASAPVTGHGLLKPGCDG
jgi:predicted RNA-binding protein (virulence factor B family)